MLISGDPDDADKIKSLIINALILSSDVYKEFKVFQTKSVKELLWGYEHYMVKIAHDMGLYPHRKIGIYYGKNGTVPGNITVLTGTFLYCINNVFFNFTQF